MRLSQKVPSSTIHPCFGKQLSYVAERSAFKAKELSRPHFQSATPTIRLFSTTNASTVTWGENNSEVRSRVHCPLCDFSMIHPEQNSKKPALIFLDIDGVLINMFSDHSLQEQIHEMKKQLFPYGHERRYYSGFQQSIVHARHFDKTAMKNLDKLIEKVEESGQRLLVVLSSAWRHWTLLEQQRTDIFAQHTFSKYLCGKTPIEAKYEESLAIEYKLGFEFDKGAHEKYNLKLDNRANAIEFWLKDHHFDPATANFVVIDDAHQEHLSRFGERFIEIRSSSLLTDSNAKTAIDVLCGDC